MTLVRTHGWDAIEVRCLPADWHNRPELIPEGVRRKIREARGAFENIFVAYGDCGTGGALDAVLEQEGVARIDGPHCYEFFAGRETFEALHEEEPGTLYLTDYLTRHFNTLIIKGLGIDRHPELEALYFGNYRRLVWLTQAPDPELEARARAAAARLGLDFAMRHTGYGALETLLGDAAQAAGRQ